MLEIEEEALDRTPWRTSFGKDYRLVKRYVMNVLTRNCAYLCARVCMYVCVTYLITPSVAQTMW